MLLIAVLAHVAVLQSAPCAWLTAADFTKVLGQNEPSSGQSAAPPAYHGQNPGTKCVYGSGHVQLIAYVDNSAEEAKSTFAKLQMFFPATSNPSSIGDDAYIDKDHAIHVLKGKVRFYIKISDSDAKVEKQARDLAQLVVARI